MEFELASARRQFQAALYLHVAVVGQHLFDQHRRQRPFVGTQRLRLHHRRATGGCDPDPAAAVAQRGRTGTTVALVAGQAIGFAEAVELQPRLAAIHHRLDLRAPDPHHPSVGGQPQAADAVVDHREQGIDRKPLRQPERLQAAAPVAQQAAVGGEPERAVRVFVEIEHVLRAVHAAHVQRLHAAIHDPRRTVGGADPQAAVARDLQRNDEFARQALGHAEMGVRAVAHPHQPAVGA